MSRSKVLHVGQGPTALSALTALIRQFDVVGLIRESSDAHDPVIRLASAQGIQVYSDTSPASLEKLTRELTPAAVVISSYDRIIPPAVFSPGIQVLNVHYSRLPQLRGRANVNWAMILGETSVGITIHRVAEGVDSGEIFFQAEVPIQSNDYVDDLYNKLNQLQEKHLGDTVARAIAGAQGTRQDESKATYCCSRDAADGELNWERDAASLLRIVHALGGLFPPAFTWYKGSRMEILKASLSPDQRRFVGRVPGRVVSISKSGGFVDVLAGSGILRVEKVRWKSEAELQDAARVIHSSRDTLGIRTEDLIDRIESLESMLRQLQLGGAK